MKQSIFQRSKKRKSSMRPKRRKHRHRSSLEKLENRNLLTVFVPRFFGVSNEFTVRRDEATPVELNVQVPYEEPFTDFFSTNRQQQLDVEVIEAGNGTVTIDDESGDILYQPEPGFVGVDLFTVVFADPGTDGSAESNRISVQAAVNVVEPLLAVDDWFQATMGDESVSLDVLANDTFNARYIGALSVPEFTLESAESEGSGDVSIDPERGTLIYTPDSEFTGLETISYTAVDQDGYSVQGRAQVRVTDQATSDSSWPEQLEQALVEKVVNANRFSFGTGASVNYFDPFLEFSGGAFTDGAIGLADATNPAPTDASRDVSGTNNQIADVDESDRIKTDGDYLYVLSEPDQDHWGGWEIFPFIDFGGLPELDTTDEDSLLLVIDIRQPDSPTIVSRQILPDKVLSLDLHGDRLTVLSQRHSADGAKTVVSVLDVSDANSVQVVSTTIVDGVFKQARRVGDTLYVFTNEYGIRVPRLQVNPVVDTDFSFYETGTEYIARVREGLVETVLPSQEVLDADGNQVDLPSVLVDPFNGGVPDGPWLNIITMDTSSDTGGAVDWDVSLGSDSGGTVLVTTESIYVTQTQYNSQIRFDREIDVLPGVPELPTITTEIGRYEIADDGTVDKSADGVVPGTLKNSFSLDEYDGSLRIATENSWRNAPTDEFGTSVYVLQQTDSTLETVGGVTGLAPGERIFAVRFAGERGYVVTFRQVDPLFVLDLSDATDPQLLGELKVDGYSQYLHVVSDTHIIGVGRDADPETGLYKGLAVSLFDVSDPSNPLLQDRYLFDGGRSTFSPFAEGDPWDIRDHHAISFFAGSSILALPFYSQHYTWRADGDENNPIFQRPEQSAVRTFKIDPESGISVVDTIEFDSRADRTLRVGEYLYSLSDVELKVTHLTQPDGLVAALDFEREGQDDFVDMPVGEDILIDVLGNDGLLDDSVVEILAASVIEGDGEVEVVDNRHLQFKANDQRLTPRRIRYTARSTAGTLVDAEATVDPDLVWRNDRNSVDTNGDRTVSPFDVLNVINVLSEHGVVDVETIESTISDASEHIMAYVDVNGDKQITPGDALQVINWLSDMAKDRVDVAFEVGQEFDVRLDEVARIPSADFSIIVSDLIQDSRCPTDANCATEGEVQTYVEILVDGEITKQALNFHEGILDTIQFENRMIRFINVTPDVQSDHPIGLDDYMFTVLVTEF